MTFHSSAAKFDVAAIYALAKYSIDEDDYDPWKY